jgi:copper chaperone CopZ
MWLLVACMCSNPTFAQIQSAKLQASGLTCAMCARSIYNNLVSLPFVDSVNTYLNASAFLIQFKKNASIDLDAIGKKVQDAGFSVAILSLTLDVKELSLQKDSHVVIDNHLFHFLNGNGRVIQGKTTFQLVDPLFVASKEFKKYSKMSSMECLKTGVVADCCKLPSNKLSSRIYHVII